MSELRQPAVIGRGPAVAELRLSIVHVRDCPLVGKLRARVESALEDTGSPAVIEEFEAVCSSPTLLIDGIALPGFPLGDDAVCRIELPTQEEIASNLLAASTAEALPEEGELA